MATATETHDAQTLAQIVALNVQVSRARLAFDRATEARKAAKEYLEERQGDLNAFIAGLGEEYPLWEGDAAAGTVGDSGGDVDINAELEAGVREAEAAPDAWRLAAIGTLGLAEETVDLLDRHVIATAGELVALVKLGAAWMGPEAQADVEAALTRFRHRRSNAEIEDFDVARGGESWAEPAEKGKRTRKAKAS
jgi:hypothetical protein